MNSIFKKYLCFVFLFVMLFSFAQNRDVKWYFGIPLEKVEFQKNDKILTDLPIINYNRGVFFYQNNPILERLLEFFKSNEKIEFEIKMHKCVTKGSTEYKKRFIKGLVDFLIKYFRDKNSNNVEVNQFDFPSCNDNFVQDRTDPNFIASGNYLEIIVR